MTYSMTNWRHWNISKKQRDEEQALTPTQQGYSDILYSLPWMLRAEFFPKTESKTADHSAQTENLRAFIILNPTKKQTNSNLHWEER